MVDYEGVFCRKCYNVPQKIGEKTVLLTCGNGSYGQRVGFRVIEGTWLCLLNTQTLVACKRSGASKTLETDRAAYGLAENATRLSGYPSVPRACSVPDDRY